MKNAKMRLYKHKMQPESLGFDSFPCDHVFLWFPAMYTQKILLHLTLDLLSARLAQSVEHQTFNLRVEGSSPSLGANVLKHTRF